MMFTLFLSLKRNVVLEFSAELSVMAFLKKSLTLEPSIYDIYTEGEGEAQVNACEWGTGVSSM